MATTQPSTALSAETPTRVTTPAGADVPTLCAPAPDRARTHRNALAMGYRLHWYVIERILGQGGFGITYLARDTNLHQHVAIKEYLPTELAVRERDDSVHPVSEGHGEDFRWGLERFLDEARTLARFDHPNIVRVLSVFEHNNTAYMVMRYEQGHSLQELLPPGGTLDEARLRAMLFPVLDGLAGVHAQGFIHRDIKPANLFVREDGTAVLLDFGSARQSLGEETRTLTTLVSPGYAPFEQYHARSDRQGPWTDVYALGATLYRAVTGVAPADAVTRSESLLRGGPDPLVPAAVAAPGGCTPGFLAAIDCALAFRGEERPKSLEAWAREFGPATHRAEPVAEDEETLDDEDVTVVNVAAPVVRAPLYRAFLGREADGPWLARFAAFDRRGARLPISWSWPAALMTLPWLAWRRCFPWMAAYPLAVAAGAVAILAPLSLLAFGGAAPPPRVVLPVVALLAVLLPGLFGNAVVWLRARSSVERALTRHADPQLRARAAAARGGTSRRAAVLTLGVLLLLTALAGRQASRRAAPDVPVAGPQQQQPAATATAGLDAPTPADRGTGAHAPVAEAADSAPPARADRGARVHRLMAQVREAAARKDFDQARSHLEAALALDPGNPRLQRLQQRALRAH